MNGRLVVVTGAAGGLGRACSAALADTGADVVLCDSNLDGLAELEVQLKPSKAFVALHRADLRGVEAGRSAIEAILARFRRIDGLVSCVGVNKTTPFGEVSPEEWSEVMEIDLDGVFGTVQAAGRRMVEQGHGAIVNVSSVAGRSGRPDNVHYAAAKAAVISLTRSAARALAPNVRVNAVCPGVVMTPMWDAILVERAGKFGDRAATDYLEQLKARTPLARTGSPEEIADVILFLLSDRSSFVTGQTLNVDGGLEMD